MIKTSKVVKTGTIRQNYGWLDQNLSTEEYWDCVMKLCEGRKLIQHFYSDKRTPLGKMDDQKYPLETSVISLVVYSE